MLKIFKKMENNSFLKHSKNYLIAEFFIKGSMFLTIPIFTRLLNPEEYGILAVYGSIVTIFTVILGLNFHGSVTRYYHEKSPHFKEFLKTNISFLLVFNILCIPFFYVTKDTFGNFFNISENIFFIALLVSSLSSFFSIYLSYLRTSQQSPKYAVWSSVKNILIIIFSVIWTYLLIENRYYGSIYPQLIITLCIVSYLFFKFKWVLTNKLNITHLKYAVFFGIPLIPHALSGIVLTQFDRVMINQMIGSLETGFYSFAYNIGMIMNVILFATNNSWTPIFYKNLKEKNYESIQNLAKKYSKGMFLIAFGLILFSKELVLLMADSAYSVALPIVPIIIISYLFVFLYTLYAGYSFYHKKTGLISINTFLAGFTNIVLNYIFIPKYGYIAAAWTTLVSYVLLFVLHYCNSKYLLKENVISLKNMVFSLSIFTIFLTGYYSLAGVITSTVMLFLIKIGFLGGLGLTYFGKNSIFKKH
jgi:O-antigen/teichoic acid export membrane protein